MIGGSEHLDAEDRAFLETLVPEDALDPHLLAIVTWMDPDTGESLWRFYAPDTTLVSHRLGLLELVKHSLLTGRGCDDDD